MGGVAVGALSLLARKIGIWATNCPPNVAEAGELNHRNEFEVMSAVNSVVLKLKPGRPVKLKVIELRERVVL